MHFYVISYVIIFFIIDNPIKCFLLIILVHKMQNFSFNCPSKYCLYGFIDYCQHFIDFHKEQIDIPRIYIFLNVIAAYEKTLNYATVHFDIPIANWKKREAYKWLTSPCMSDMLFFVYFFCFSLDVYWWGLGKKNFFSSW